MTTTPIPASTVLIGRENRNTRSLELLLLLRNKASSFMPSYYVFPGGAVEKDDRDQRISRIAQGENSIPGKKEEEVFPDSHGNSLLTYKYAAIRETFEECGLLLASGNGDNSCFEISQKIIEEREKMSKGKGLFIDLLSDLKVSPVTDKLLYLTSFVTPEFSPKRYDAKFFFSPCPRSQEISIDGKEIVDYSWESPADALKKNGEGSLPLAVPTLHMIKKFTAFDNYSAVIDALYAGKMIF